MKQGKIQVDSYNLMPIIKKWLYSDKDIFLREVVSNASDAISKLKKLRDIGKADDDGKELCIIVRSDKEKGTLSIEDNGIGMTEEEVVKYITQVAFSGASDFINKYSETNGDGIIGHFGLGFYSTFMVSKTVEVDTLSYQGGEAVHFISDGGEDYTLDVGQRTGTGTTVILNLADAEKEFLEEHVLSELLHKYCAFMPYPIYLNPEEQLQRNKEAAEKHKAENKEGEGEEFDDEETLAPEAVNNTNPLYLKNPKDCTKEEYISFFRETFHEFDEPLLWIHLNVDYPFNLKGILYFPKQKDEINIYQGEIKLYSNQVFIADNIKEIIPEFLMLLKGVIDSPDIPLNVSRSFLQSDRDVRKLSNHITKKVADKIKGMFNTEREELEKCWGDISPFIKFGCVKNDDFYDQVKDCILYKTVDDKFVTMNELCENKGDVYYVSDVDAQSQYVKMYKDEGLTPIVLNHYIDSHFISYLEYKNSELKFKRVDSQLPTKSEDVSVDNVAELIEMFKREVDTDSYTVKVQAVPSAMPVIIIADEHKRRYNEMSKAYAQMFNNKIPDEYQLLINLNNEVIKSLGGMEESKQTAVVKYAIELARLARGEITSKGLDDFISSSADILNFVK